MPPSSHPESDPPLLDPEPLLECPPPLELELLPHAAMARATSAATAGNHDRRMCLRTNMFLLLSWRFRATTRTSLLF